jgi:serine/threonine protein kinase
LAQQCCDTTLADVIHSSQPLEEVHLQWFLYQILTALKYIHSADVSKYVISSMASGFQWSNSCYRFLRFYIEIWSLVSSEPMQTIR